MVVVSRRNIRSEVISKALSPKQKSATQSPTETDQKAPPPPSQAPLSEYEIELQKIDQKIAELEQEKANLPSVQEARAEITAQEQAYIQRQEQSGGRVFASVRAGYSKKRRRVKEQITNKFRRINNQLSDLREKRKTVTQARQKQISIQQQKTYESKFEAQERVKKKREEEARIEAEKQAFESGREAQPGVYSTADGRQLIITEGKKPETAGELVRRLEGTPFTPGRLTRPAGKEYVVTEPGRREAVPQAVTRTPETVREDVSRSERRQKEWYELSFTELSANLRQRSEELRTQNIRDPTVKGKVLAGVTGFVGSVADVGAFVEQTVKKPKETLTTAGKEFYALASGKKQAVNVGKALRDDPAYSSGRIAGELLILKGTGEGIRLVDTATLKPRSAVANVLTANRLPVEKTAQAPLGTIAVPTSAGVRNVQIAGAMGSKTLPGETLSQQVARGGTTSPIAVSGARDFFNFFTQKKTIDKPLPTPDSPPLERSFFADPEGKLRPSRLGILDEPGRASIVDQLVGDAGFFRQKPQAIIISDAKIESLPKNLFDIEKRLRGNKPLSPSQQERLLKFQLTPSGQFKPVGFISRESEITLAPGEQVIREGTRGYALIEGRNVKFLEVKVGQPKGVIKKGDVLTKTDARGRVVLTEEGSRLLKQPKIISSRPPIPRSTASRGLTGSRTVSSGISSPGISSPISRPGTSSPTGSSIIRGGSTSGTSFTTRGGSTSTGSPGSPSRTTRGSGTTRGGFGSIAPPTAKTFIPRTSRKRTRTPGFNVFVNVKGTFQKLNTRALTKSQAITRGVAVTSTTALASFKISPAGQTIEKQDEGLSRRTRELFKAFRQPKRSSKLRTNDYTFVERRKYRIDTPGERKEITLKGIRASRGNRL